MGRVTALANALSLGADTTIRSALWAAYGDALGFISELTTVEGLRARIGAKNVSKPVAWRRQIGGRFGAYVDLPLGCYSDDTELRLATCRAIRGDGHFDVEAFAKVELPVWLSYALGGGRSTRAAATNLTRQDVTWFSNFFEGRGLRYEDAGGNGGAMRIQPHVWAAREKSDYPSFALDIIRNTLVTHGHPRALVGSLFHGFCLGFALKRKEVPGPADWKAILQEIPDYASLVHDDGDLASFWLPSWESRFGMDIKAALAHAGDECVKDLSVVESLLAEGSSFDYEGMLRAIGALEDHSRGSATKTAIAATTLAWAYQASGPEPALERAANVLSSDTDTIATMAGAILGSVIDRDPDAEILDRDYIVNEASRLHSIAAGHRAESFRYPDLMRWQPPQSQVDALVALDGDLSITGLGQIQVVGRRFPGRGRNDAVWQWVKLAFGQTVLIKGRSKLPDGAEIEHRSSKEDRSASDKSSMSDIREPMLTLFPLEDKNILYQHQAASNTYHDRRFQSLHDITQEVIRADFDPTLIGRWLLYLSSQEDGIERAIGFAAIIAKARLARSRAQR